MKRCAYWFVVAVLLLCSSYATPSQGAGGFSITGRVVDYAARPAHGAEVTVYEQKYHDGERVAELIGPVVTTDSEGRFELKADVASQYGTFIVARKPGLAMAWDGLNYGRHTLGRAHFLLVLEKPCTLTGVVTDGQGRPVSGAAVQAVPKTSYMRRLSQRPIIAPREWFTAETDKNGVFRFEDLAADVSSDFWVKAPSWECTYKFTTHYLSRCGYEVGRDNIHLVLPAERPVRGRVVNAATGEPVAGIALTIKADRDRGDIKNTYVSQAAVTDASGAFACSGLPEGKNKIALALVGDGTSRWAAKPVTVDVASETALEDVQLPVERGQIIECAVRDGATNRPLPGMRASAYSEAHAARWQSVTDEDGVARMRVLPGEYDGYVSGGGYDSWNVNEPVIVEPDQAKQVDVLLDGEPSIEGLVLGSVSSPGTGSIRWPVSHLRSSSMRRFRSS